VASAPDIPGHRVTGVLGTGGFAAHSGAGQVLPPDEAAFGSGARAYRCIAHQITGVGTGRAPQARRGEHQQRSSLPSACLQISPRYATDSRM